MCKTIYFFEITQALLSNGSTDTISHYKLNINLKSCLCPSNEFKSNINSLLALISPPTPEGNIVQSFDPLF